MKDLILKRCLKNDIWDDFVKSSTQGSIFCNSKFIDSLGIEYELWFIEKHNKPCCGVAILLNACGEPVDSPFSFTLYQGILFSHASFNMTVNKRTSEEMQLIEFMLTELEKRYEKISLCLHYDMHDLRSFSWFHYHQPDLGKFNMDLRYTGIIDLLKDNSFQGYLKSIRKSRRYEYNKCLNSNFRIEISTNISILKKLYCLTFERQNIKVKEEILVLLKNITQAALENEFGEILICRDDNGDVVAATLFLHDEHCCYYLIGANHPDHRKSGAGTFIVLESIRRYMEAGYKFADVCGLNSPNREDFKTSLNAKPVPYYNVSWQSQIKV